MDDGRPTLSRYPENGYAHTPTRFKTMSTQTLPCAHSGCTDPVECVIEDETGERWGLCEDHAHMNMDGTAEDGYDPNDPEKFSDPPN